MDLAVVVLVLIAVVGLGAWGISKLGGTSGKGRGSSSGGSDWDFGDFSSGGDD